MMHMLTSFMGDFFFHQGRFVFVSKNIFLVVFVSIAGQHFVVWIPHKVCLLGYVNWLEISNASISVCNCSNSHNV